MKSMFALAVGLLFALPVVAQPLEGFLKIDGVKGEVTDPGHKKWMRITGISSLPEGCVGDEGGGHLTVRVNRKPEAKYLPSLGGWDGASARFELTDPNGEPLVMVLYDVYASNTYSGSGSDDRDRLHSSRGCPNGRLRHDHSELQAGEVGAAELFEAGRGCPLRIDGKWARQDL